MKVYLASIESHRHIGFERHVLTIVGYHDGANDADETAANLTRQFGDNVPVVDVGCLSEPVRDHLSILLIGAHR